MRHRVATALVIAANSQSAGFPVENQNEMNLYMSLAATGGTTPTLDVKYQVSPDQGTTWFDSGSAFAQQTANGQSILRIAANIGTLGRLVYTVGGTTPTFTADIWAEGKRFDG